MTSLRDVLIAVGIATAGIGLLFIFFPTLAGPLSLPEATIVIIGFIALVQGARSIQKRRQATIDQATPPDPEDQLTTPRPGEEFDDRLLRLRDTYSRVASSEEERVRERLRATATDILVTTKNISPEEARTQIDRGTWTNDPIAASFIGGSDAPESPFGFRLQSRVGAESYTQRCAIRTTDEIVKLWDDR